MNSRNWFGKTISLLLIVSLFSACSSATKQDASATLPTEDYKKLILANTDSAEKNSGLYNLFRAHGTILNSKVQMAMLERLAFVFQWDPAQVRLEREKRLQEMGRDSKVYLSFFTPETDYNDLNKGNSIWKVYLEVDGSRYVGKVQKLKMKPVQVMDLLPLHGRFDTAYEVSFPIPMASVEKRPAQLIVTSALGHATLKFPAAE